MIALVSSLPCRGSGKPSSSCLRWQLPCWRNSPLPLPREVNSHYSVVILMVRKPMSQGVELLANYTLSKAANHGASLANVHSDEIRSGWREGIYLPWNSKPSWLKTGSESFGPNTDEIGIGAKVDQVSG